MKTTVLILTIGFVMTQCNLSNSKNDRIEKENGLIIYSLLQADTLIEEKYAIVRQRSYDLSIFENNDEFKISFYNKSYSQNFTDYFEISDTLFIKRQLNSNKGNIWNTYQLNFFDFIDSDSLRNIFDSTEFYKKHEGYQFISIPIYNEIMDRTIISIKKVIGFDECEEIKIIVLDKRGNNWIINKVIDI